MAQRLEVTMSNGVAEVNHNGETATFDLPEWFRAHEAFFDEDALVNHCAEHGILLATLQAGFAQLLIELRARSKPADLPPERNGKNAFEDLLKEGYSREQALKMTRPTPQKLIQEEAQERVDGFKPASRTPAEDAVTKAAKLLRGLTDAQKAALKAQGLI